MQLALARGAHELRFGLLHGLQCLVTITRRDRFLHLTDGSAYACAARFVDHGAAGDLARCFAGGGGVGHVLYLSLSEVKILNGGEGFRRQRAAYSHRVYGRQ